MEDQEKIYNEQYPEKDFKKTTYSFTPQEIRNLTTFVTLTQMGKIAEVMSNNFVSNEVVRRLGVKTTLDSGILYDVAVGQVVVYIPKVVCMECGTRRAEYTYNSKNYCKTCVDLMQKKKPEVKKK